MAFLNFQFIEPMVYFETVSSAVSSLTGTSKGGRPQLRPLPAGPSHSYTMDGVGTAQSQQPQEVTRAWAVTHRTAGGPPPGCSGT